MLRIQLIVDDYAEIVSLSTMLKKVGFDVDSTQNPLALADSLLRLNPDVLIMSAAGRRVNGVELAQQVRKVRGLPHIILLNEVTQVPGPGPAIDAWVTTPVDGPMLLRNIARVCLLNEYVLLDKYRAKMGLAAAPTAQVAADQSRIGGSSLADEDRRRRYQKFLDEARPSSHGLASAQVRDQVKALRRGEAADADADLERERREFVDHLFRKKD